MSAYREQMRTDLTDVLPKSAHKHIDAILDYFGVVEALSKVEIVGARVAVDEVEAYGLTIELDANGNAAAVGFPYGAEVAA